MDTLEKDTMVDCSNPAETSTSFIQSLHLEESTKHIEMLKKLIFNTSDTPNEKVEALRQALSAGQYEIKSQHIAHKIMEYCEPELA